MTIGFEYLGDQPRAAEIRLMRSNGGETERLFGDPDASAVVLDLGEVAVDGDEISLSGTLSSSFGTSENFGITIDFSAPVQADGSFSVTLGPV